MRTVTHNNIAIQFTDDTSSECKMTRFEPCGTDSRHHSVSGFAPYIVRTTNSYVSTLESCGGVNPETCGDCTGIFETENGLTLKYEENEIETTVVYEFIPDTNVIKATTTAKNISDKPTMLTHVSCGVISGICAGGLLNIFDERKVLVHYCRSIWEGEGQWRTDSLHHLGLFHKTNHEWDHNNFQISSVGSWSTGQYYPLMVIEDKECGAVWYMEVEGAYNWSIEIGQKNRDLTGGGVLYMEANCADENVNGFCYPLAPGESYTSPACIFGCTEGSFEDGVRELLKYKRKTSLTNWEKGYAPACFNNYMNCTWGEPTKERLLPSVDAAAKVGCEVFCIDDGWCIPGKNNGSWEINDEMFGEGGLAGMIKYIADKGMIPGIWLEIESILPNTFLYQKELLLTRHGEVISKKRALADFTKKEVRAYIAGIFDKLYQLGIRFVKNDYNMATKIGCDNYGTCLSEGERRSMNAFYSFIDEIKAKYPDLVIENCGSGAMRADNGTLRHFELQSTSDQELYRYNPSIVMGTLAFLAPEKAGVWSYPYPVTHKENANRIAVWEQEDYCAQMKDGEQTVFNMVTALCGTLYLSGRIDKADAFNFALIKEGVKAFKKYRTHNQNSYPVYPCGHFSMADNTYSSLGLMAENKRKMTLAVWRRNSISDTLTIDLSKYTTKKTKVKLAYPSDPLGAEFSFSPATGILTVRLPKHNSARFFEISL